MSGFHPEPSPGLASKGHPEAEPSGAFTPGPWTAFNMVHAERGDAMTPEELGEYVTNNVRKSLEYGGSADRFLFITSAGDAAPDICHVGNGPAGPANARLIAAAPDLLAALEEILCCHDGNQAAALNLPDLDYARRTISTMHRIARAAIAKAEVRS